MRAEPLAPGPVAVRAAAAILLICSHVLLVPSIVWTWRRLRQLWIEFAILVCIFAWSTAYHTCYQTGYCLFDAQHHRATDHYHAKLCVPLVVFYLACIDRVYVKGLFVVLVAQLDVLCSVLFPVGAAGGSGADASDESSGALISNALFIAACFALAAAYWLATWRLATVRWHDFDWIDALFGAVLCSSAPIFFLASDSITDDDYYFAHSLWHALAFAGVYFVFETRNPERTLGVPTTAWVRFHRLLVRRSTGRADADHIVGK